MSSFVHERALVESESIGEGTRIWAYSHVLAGAVIGKNCNIGDHCFIENDVQIGDSAVIKNGVSVWDGITIEEFVFVGPNVAFTNDLHPRAKAPYTLTRTLVRHHATIGANSTVLAGVTIGEYALIGAGSVVTKDVPPYTCVVGSPARFLQHVCRCGHRVGVSNGDSRCTMCGTTYVLADRGITPAA